MLHPPSSKQLLSMYSPTRITIDHGPRGTGKSDTFFQTIDKCLLDQNQPWSKHFQLVLLRYRYKGLEELRNRTRAWFNERYGPKGYDHRSDRFTAPGGEQVILDHAQNKEKFNEIFQGRETSVLFDELTQWPNDEVFNMACHSARAKVPGMPSFVKAATNPYGPGMKWVKRRFISVSGPLEIHTVRSEAMKGIIGESVDITQQHIPYTLQDNINFVRSNPMYYAGIFEDSNPAIRAAWGEGSWDIESEGYLFGDILNQNNWHKLILPRDEVPASWRIKCTYDDGYSRDPYCALFYAVSDGTGTYAGRSWPRGSVIFLYELYGSIEETPGPNPHNKKEPLEDTINRLKQAAKRWPKHWVEWGPADSSTWDRRDEYTTRGQRFHSAGIHFVKFHKFTGSRASGFNLERDMLFATERNSDAPQMAICKDCKWLIYEMQEARENEDGSGNCFDDDLDNAMDAGRYAVLDNAKLGTSTVWNVA